MTENIGYEDATEMLDPKSVTQIVIAALRNVVGLALGAAIDDGRFDEHVAMILAEGIQVAVGSQTFWVNVFRNGDERVHLRKRDARWRRVVEALLDSTLGARTMRDGLERIVDEPNERLTDEGIAARDAYRDFQRLLKET